MHYSLFCVFFVFIGSDNRSAEIRYDPANTVYLSGAVQDVREAVDPPALRGVHVSLNLGKKIIEVYIAPASFLKTFGISVAKGDQLQFSGSKIRYRGADLVLARQIRKDKDILVLRDENGNPYWEDELLKRSCGSGQTRREVSEASDLRPPEPALVPSPVSSNRRMC